MSAEPLAPLVTLAIPLYRSFRFLDVISENIRNADYPNLEILVGDRHLADDTVEQLRVRCAGDRPLPVHHLARRGLWAATTTTPPMPGRYLWMPRRRFVSAGLHRRTPWWRCGSAEAAAGRLHPRVWLVRYGGCR